MNERLLALCASPKWAEAVQKWIIPWVLEDVDLGNDVLEVGPGPGLTTDVLRTLTPALTAVELDNHLAEVLAKRLEGTNMEVMQANATQMPLPDEPFSGAVCPTMLHHVPTSNEQDEVFKEMRHVLRPGGALVGQGSWSCGSCTLTTRMAGRSRGIARARASGRVHGHSGRYQRVRRPVQGSETVILSIAPAAMTTLARASTAASCTRRREWRGPSNLCE
jgi:SAM-dependent methyltransferase